MSSRHSIVIVILLQSLLFSSSVLFWRVVLHGQVILSQLDCYPQIDETTLNEWGHPIKGTKFSCGSQNFVITAYDETLADSHLGGHFPVTKTLAEIGCKLNEKQIMCREEVRSKLSVRSGGREVSKEVLAYREIVAKLTEKN